MFSFAFYSYCDGVSQKILTFALYILGDLSAGVSVLFDICPSSNLQTASFENILCYAKINCEDAKYDPKLHKGTSKTIFKKS